jgi:hypothetical protein
LLRRVRHRLRPPPRSHSRTEISRLLGNRPELAGLRARLVSANGRADPTAFSASLSLAAKFRFPETETVPSQRLGSNAAPTRRKTQHLTLSGPFRRQASQNGTASNRGTQIQCDLDAAAGVLDRVRDAPRFASARSCCCSACQPVYAICFRFPVRPTQPWQFRQVIRGGEQAGGRDLWGGYQIALSLGSWRWPRPGRPLSRRTRQATV